MNNVKNELRTALADSTLKACMAFTLDSRTVDKFLIVEMFNSLPGPPGLLINPTP